MNANELAFLTMISVSEGTDKAPDPYAVTFGYKFTITDFSNHPALLGWHGVSIESLGQRYIKTFSTAAGRYQIIRSTWITCQTFLELPDFGPSSQDAAALWLIKQQGALGMVARGDIVGAIHRCRNVWASLPGSISGQPQQTLAVLLGSYMKAGGVVA